MDRKDAPSQAGSLTSQNYFRHPNHYALLCQKLNYQFRDIKLLAQAFTTKAGLLAHKSAVGHHEELAFDGDSILSLAVNRILNEKCPYYDKGQLTQIRSLLVQNANLIGAARKLGLEQFIMMDANQEKQCREGDPKFLADTIEALICAIYRDSENDLNEVQLFILAHSNIAQVLQQHLSAEQEKNEIVIRAVQTCQPAVVRKVIAQGYSVNFLFMHIENEFDDDPLDPGVIEHEHFSSPLELAIGFLEDLATDGKDCSSLLEVIDCLLEAGATLDLHSKRTNNLFHKIFSPITKDGRIADPFMAEFMQEKSDRASSLFSGEMRKMFDEMALPGWEKITDRLVQVLCKYRISFSEETQESFHSALEMSIIHKQRVKFDCLLTHKTDPNSRSRNGRTPLHLAAACGDEYAISQLIAHQADPNLEDLQGLKPFDLAKSKTIKFALLKAEIQRSAPLQPSELDYKELSQRAITFYQEGTTQQSGEKLAQATQLFTLVLKHALSKRDIESKDLATHFFNLGMTYFKRNQFERAVLFLERAYVFAEMNKSQADQYSKKYQERYEECANKLKQTKSSESKKSDTKSKDLLLTALPEKDRALFEAITIYHKEKVAALLSEGANSNAKNANGQPVLHHAIQVFVSASLLASASRDLDPYRVGIGSFPRQMTTIISSLLNFLADPNARDEKGRTALHEAAIADKPELIGPLLRCGADPTLRDHAKRFASSYAKKSSTRRLILAGLMRSESSELKYGETNTRTFLPSPNIQPGMIRIGDLLASCSTSSFSSSMPLASAQPSTPNAPTPSSSLFSSTHINKPAGAKKSGKNQKTRLCHFFKEGQPNSCTKGTNCKFAHGATELAKK